MGFALVDHSRRYLLSKWADRLSASISRELARGNRCEVELAGPVSSPAHPPPAVNARTLLTHAAGSGPAHWSADGYLSAVARTGPDVVWPLEEGGPPASCIGTGAQRFVATDAAVADVGARQAFSIAGWCCIADAASDPDVEIVRKLSGQGAQASGYRLSYARATAALTVAVAHAGATGPSGSWTAAATLADECWRHYAVVYGSDALDVWVDGVRVLRQTAGIGFDRSLAATSGLALGDAQMTTGIDDWAFWRRKLTDTEIRNLYAARPGRSGFDFRALLASGRPRGVVSFDTGTVAPAIGTADLPAGMAAALPAANLPLPAVGSRSAGVPYSWAAWLRVDWIPRSAYDVRLAKNDGAVTVGLATPVRGRSRGNASGALTDDGLRFAAEVVVTYRGGATSRWQKVDVTAAGVLRFESTAAVPAAEKAAYALVLVRLDDDGAAAFTRVRDLAATTWAGGVTQWPADTRLRDDVTGQSFVGSWSVLVVDHDVAHFDAHTLVWQPEETAPVPIWRRGGAAGQSMEVQYRPRAGVAGRHRHALRTGSLPVPSRSSPVRYARDGVAFALGASGVTLLTGGSSDVILGSAAGRGPVAITRITAAADALTIDLGGNLHASDAGHYAFLAVNARDGATFVFRFSADTSSPPSSDPYEIPRRGVGSALRAASHLANRWRLLVVDTSFADLNTTRWTWQDDGAPHTFAVRLTGPSVDGVTGAVEEAASVQDDGAWHHVAWSLTEDGLSLWLDGTLAPASPVPVRLAGSIWTGAQPVDKDDATRLLALGVSAPGDGTFAGRNGAFVLEPANAGETLALLDTDGTRRYVHRLHVSFTSATVTTVYIGLALLRTAGAVNARANLLPAAVNAYRVYVRVRRAGMRDAVLSADLSADANIATPYVVAAETPDDFSFRSRAGAVFDVVIVDKRPEFGFDETAETVPGAGLDLHEVDYDVTTTLTRVPFHASNAPAAASASPLRAVFRTTASVAGNGDVTLTPDGGVSTTLHLPDGTTRSMDLSGVEVSSRRLRLTLRGNPVASAAVRNYRLVLSRVPGVGGSRTFRVWDFAAAVQQVNRFDWTVSDFNALIGEFTAGAQVDVAVFDTTYRRDRADGYVDDWTAPKVETAAVGDGVLVGRARSVGAIDELADWTRAVDSREWAAQVDACPVERVFGGLLAVPEQRHAEDGRRRVSLRLRSFAAPLEEVHRIGSWDGFRPIRFYVDPLPLIKPGPGHGALERFLGWKGLPQPITLDRVAPAVRPLTLGPSVTAYRSDAEILDRVAEEWNLLWAVDDYGALTMMRTRDVRAAVVLDDTGGVERAPRLVWDRRHLRTVQIVLGAPIEGRIVETFTGTAHTYEITEPRVTVRRGTGTGTGSWDDGKRLDGKRRVFVVHPYFVKVTSVKVRRGTASPVQQFGDGYTGPVRWFFDPGEVNQLTQANTEPVLQPADTLTISGVTSRESKGQSESQTTGVYGRIAAIERDPSLRDDLVAPRSRVLLAANDRIALRGDVRLRLGTHRGLREGMGVRLAGVPGVDERVVFLIAGVGQEIVPAAGAGPALIRTTLALQADDVPVTGSAPQETFAGRYRRLPPVAEEGQGPGAPDAVRWPALTAGSFVRVNTAGTGLEMRTPAQVLADLLPALTAESFLRVNSGGTGLEVRTSAQVLADLLPAVTAGSFLRVNPGGTLEVRTSAQVLADLLPALTAGSFLRVNSAGTGLEVRTSAQVLADLLPALTAGSFLRVNSAGTGLEVRTLAEVLADLLAAGAPRLRTWTASGTVTAPAYACRWLVAAIGGGGGGAGQSASDIGGTGGRTTVVGTGIDLRADGGEGGRVGGASSGGYFRPPRPGGGQGGFVLPGGGGAGGEGNATTGRGAVSGAGGGLALALITPTPAVDYTLTVGPGGARGAGGGHAPLPGGSGAVAILELR